MSDPGHAHCVHITACDKTVGYMQWTCTNHLAKPATIFTGKKFHYTLYSTYHCGSRTQCSVPLAPNTILPQFHPPSTLTTHPINIHLHVIPNLRDFSSGRIAKSYLTKMLYAFLVVLTLATRPVYRSLHDFIKNPHNCMPLLKFRRTFNAGLLQPYAQAPKRRGTPWRLSATAYSIYS
jgi:hypothetical protein